jgi:uncharacterized surface protein with fasciclin (FAS1) repeats
MKLSNKIYLLAAIAGIQFITACNKDLETVAAPATVTAPVPTGDTIRKFISANSKYALFDSCLNITGLKTTVLNQAGNLTVFAADTTAYKQLAYGLSIAIGATDPTLLSKPNDTAAKFFRARATVISLKSIMQYNIMEGKITGANMPTNFPNTTFPSFVALDATTAIRLPVTLSSRGAQAYLNSIPLQAKDVFTGFNGVVHESPQVNVPPSATLKTMIAGEATLKYFRAAVARADVGSTGLSRLDSLLNYGVTNMTVLTPNDAAMQPVLKGVLTLGYIQAGLSPFSADSLAALKSSVDSLASPTAGFNIVPVANVRGIVAYHFLATNSTGSYTPNIRVFSVNVPSAANSFVKTLVNGSFATHPGILALATFGASPIPTAVTFTGLGTFPSGGAPFSSPAANVVTKDKHAVNGVYHIIDRVLLPQ